MRAEYSVKSKTRVEMCNGLHAEQAAILDSLKILGLVDRGLRHKYGPYESTMYHVAIAEEDGEWNAVPSGDPTFSLCRKMVLDSGIRDFVLWHGGDEYESYSAHEFNRLSLENVVRAYEEERGECCGGCL